MVACPKCNSKSVAQIFYGLPAADWKDTLQERCGGCVVWNDAPRYHCNDCSEEFGKMEDYWKANGISIG